MTEVRVRSTINKKPTIFDHFKVLIWPVGLSFGVIFLSSKSSTDSITPAAKCISISADSKRELSIKGDEPVVIVRPHGCQSCSRNEIQLKSSIKKSKRRFICLIDADASSDDVRQWQETMSVKVYRRDTINFDLRRITLGLYLLPRGGNEACWVEPNAI